MYIFGHSMATGLVKHFQIKWVQDYMVGLICPLYLLGLTNLTSEWTQIPTDLCLPPGLGSSAFHAQAD